MHFWENNLNADGSVNIPEALRPPIWEDAKLLYQRKNNRKGESLCNSYLRSIGFSTITSKKQMDQILKSVIEDYDDKMVIECENNASVWRNVKILRI